MTAAIVKTQRTGGMLRGASLVAALALVSGCSGMMMPPAAPEAVTPQPRPVPQAPADRLLTSIEANGCVLTSDNLAPVLLRANLTQQELREVTPQLISAGRAEIAGQGQIRVLTDTCI
ncbi:hypothetical protein [Pseudoroseicyclus aestuarii]|uniref:Uncharacterized protein n=1 Tax=Pseudoroseicyclus aestuarii TaxID=1795041 RepID=A0A318SRB8_9RHOB|nr:hypothetical protein [Pseudoroseicyclus aestuarii]PYE84142.1 hypothetical protein DFP88_103509 [Pseudoroseicyclus aestuarii]